jgi:ferrous iron transport protein A
MPLDLLQTGQWADITDLHGDPDWLGRMAELGLRPGTRLRMLQAGSPCLLQVGDTRLSLRGDNALQILVRPVSI